MWQFVRAPATATSVSRARSRAGRAPAALLLAAALAACAGGPVGETDLAGPRPAAAAPDPGPALPAPGHGPDALKSSEEVRHTETELLSLGERQRAEAGGARSRSIVEEMKAVGRSHAGAAARRIEADSQKP